MARRYWKRTMEITAYSPLRSVLHEAWGDAYELATNVDLGWENRENYAQTTAIRKRINIV
jgi:hypothetical protein